MATDALVQRVLYKIKDNVGKIGSMAFMIVTNPAVDPITTLAGLVTLFNAISDGVVTGQIGETACNESASNLGTNPYSIRDKLIVEYVDAENAKHNLAIGDPDTAIFLTGSELPDPANTEYLALVSAIETNVKGKDGNPVVVKRAYRQRSRNLKGSERFL